MWQTGRRRALLTMVKGKTAEAWLCTTLCTSGLLA
jgi:hypothetical protein